MKNNRKTAIAFVASVLLLVSSCQQGPKKDGADPEKPEKPRDEQVSPPRGIISLEESKSLYDNYTKHRLDMIHKYEMERKPDEEFVPARYSDFDYATIKQYLAFVEQEAKEAGVDVSTLRVYFANYPDKERFPDGEKVVHPRQNSIFLVPTMKVDGQNWGFYIGADGKAKLIKDATGITGTSQKEKASMAPSFSILSEEQSLALDRSTSGPPPNTDY